MIYAVDELQSPLRHTTVLCKGDRNSTGGTNGVFPNSQRLWLSIQHCMKGVHNSHFCCENGMRVEDS